MSARIWFDAKDLEDCRRVFRELLYHVSKHHGPVAARRLFVEMTPPKRALQEAQNDLLLAEYVESGLSVEKFAEGVAEKNKSLSRDRRRGPSGSTSAATLAKQIRRQKKAMEQDLRRRSYIERLAKHLPDIS
jgi:hypothetical protein